VRISSFGLHSHANPQKKDADLEFTHGFHIRFCQIARILNTITGERKPSRFGAKMLARATGLSSDQAGTQARIAAGMGLLVPRSYRLTALGQLVVEQDVFLEDLGTLWLCHYALSASPRRPVWNHLANCLLPTESTASLGRVRATLKPIASFWPVN
jgi:hypothetical protein